MDELHVPAVSVAVVEEGDVAATRAWGTTPKTVFQAASISKPVTAMGALRLASDGVLDLDASVNAQLTSWQIPDGDDVSVRHVLCHGAGLSVHGFAGYEAGDDVPTLEQILDGARPANSEAVRVVRPPGEAFQYSGGGFTVLQVLMQDVTQRPFAELIDDLVLHPLGMRSSTFVQPLPLEREAQAAIGHDGLGAPIPGRWRTHPEQAAAGLWTHPADLARTACEMIGPGRVLDADSCDEMLSPQVDAERGLGWMLAGDGWFGHGGSNIGFTCNLTATSGTGHGVVVMTNSDAAMLTLLPEVVATVAEAYGWDGYLRERAAVDLERSVLERVAGDYEVFDGFAVSIKLDGVRLLSSAPSIPEGELFASSESEFFRADLDATITCSGDELTVEMSGMRLVGRRRAN